MITFKSFNLEFLEKSWEWLQDNEIKQLTDTPAFTKEEQLIWFETLQQNKSYLAWGISFDEKPIGVLGLKKITEIDCEFFTYIGQKEYWGRGLGTEIIKFAKEHAFMTLNLKSIHLKVLNNNSRAIALYKKNGFAIQYTDHKYSIMRCFK